MTRVAVIDIGTVTARLGLAEVAGSHVMSCQKTSTICSLGEGVAETGMLSAAACERVLGCVDGYLAHAREAGVEACCCTLTSAARDASNANVLLGGLRERGVVPQVIPGELEGSLTFLGVAQDFVGQRIAVADNGGGSTEIAVGVLGATGRADTAGQSGVAERSAATAERAEATAVSFAHRSGEPCDNDASAASANGCSVAPGVNLEAVCSLDVGCRRVTDLFLSREDPPTAADLEQAKAFCREAFEAGLPRQAVKPERLVCVGGTVTTLVAVSASLVPYDASFVHLHSLSLAEVDELALRLASLPLEQRREVAGLQPKRANVIVAGAVCVGELMRACGVGELTVSESDLLYGLSLATAAAADGAEIPVPWEPQLFSLR